MTYVEARRGTVLVVCTANVCRSPLAQRTLQRRFADVPAFAQVTVLSAGTDARQGSAMCEVSAALLKDDEDWVHQHRAHELTSALVAQSDLVLTLERRQRSQVTQLLPGSQTKVFTMVEAAELAEALLSDQPEDIADIPALPPRLHATRGLIPPPVGRWSRSVDYESRLTIDDGHGQSGGRHRRAVQSTATASIRLISALQQLVDPAASRDPRTGS